MTAGVAHTQPMGVLVACSEGVRPPCDRCCSKPQGFCRLLGLACPAPCTTAAKPTQHAVPAWHRGHWRTDHTPAAMPAALPTHTLLFSAVCKQAARMAACARATAVLSDPQPVATTRPLCLLGRGSPCGTRSQRPLAWTWPSRGLPSGTWWPPDRRGRAPSACSGCRRPAQTGPAPPSSAPACTSPPPGLRTKLGSASSGDRAGRPQPAGGSCAGARATPGRPAGPGQALLRLAQHPVAPAGHSPGGGTCACLMRRGRQHACCSAAWLAGLQPKACSWRGGRGTVDRARQITTHTACSAQKTRQLTPWQQGSMHPACTHRPQLGQGARQPPTAAGSAAHACRATTALDAVQVTGRLQRSTGQSDTDTHCRPETIVYH